MKIFDCFMYFDEDLILDLRLNTLNKFIDYFVIVESIYNHKGEKRKLKFNIKKFKKFNNKIIYLIHNQVPNEIKKINKNDSENEINTKYIFNAIFRENSQRNYILKGLSKAKDDDIILISDVDEIPNLKKVNFKKLKNKLIFFNQEMFYYKFNLKLPNYNWIGTKSCKKKYLKNPQWLRNIKDRKYPFYRLDTFFSDKKFSNVEIIENGGWHFTNIKTAEQIRYKLKSYLHHREFEVNPVTKNQIEKLIKNRIAIYDLRLDKRSQKIGQGSKLQKYNLKKLPEYIIDNKKKYKKWID
jgi:beta-1,4-mannosyl-glycoprotein beta-1,4-N-acetylglucosaminyltransferase